MRDTGTWPRITPGLGVRTNPPTPAWQSLKRHVELTGSLLEDLDLHDVTVVVHDWGGPIGLTLALAYPDRISRIVILNTVIDSREVWINKAWGPHPRLDRASTEDLAVGGLVRAICHQNPPDDVVAAYEAPFPTPESKASLRGLVMSVPGTDDKSAGGTFGSMVSPL